VSLQKTRIEVDGKLFEGVSEAAAYFECGVTTMYAALKKGCLVKKHRGTKYKEPEPDKAGGPVRRPGVLLRFPPGGSPLDRGTSQLLWR
jgi:hypothetical protein